MHDALAQAYAMASRRLFLLDYDGTLADLVPTPPEAAPMPKLMHTLARLGSDPRNVIVIISGRDQQTLDTWLGHLPIHLVAEHGAFAKHPGQPWQAAGNVDDGWKQQIRPIMALCSSSVPGSFIEEKATCLVWHYRTAEQKVAERAAKALAIQLEPLAKKYHLLVMPGSKIIEVRPVGMNKGQSAQQWLRQQTWDFILAAGDDTTDEDLFRALPHQAHTIKIGPGTSVATHHLSSPAALLRLLESMLQSK